MELNEALAQIEDIRARVRRAQERGTFRNMTSFGTALLALVGAAVQPAAPAANAFAYAETWAALAALAFAVTVAEIHWRNRTAAARRVANALLGRFGAFLLAGGAFSAAAAYAAPQAPILLPAAWILCFGLALLAVESQLNPRVRVAAAFYVAYAVAAPFAFGAAPGALTMPLAFGVGQVLVGWALL